MNRRDRTLHKIRLGLTHHTLVTDSLFDDLYGLDIFELSRTHWTPVAVALAARQLLEPTAASHILDIGSGVGKFCLVAALSGVGRFTGIELRPALAAVARRCQADFDLEQVEFLTGDMADLDWTPFTGFYLYNPFYEHIVDEAYPGQRVIDLSLDLSPAHHDGYVRTVQAKLAACRSGTRVVTYHGFGGDFPAGYELTQLGRVGSGALELWVKR